MYVIYPDMTKDKKKYKGYMAMRHFKKQRYVLLRTVKSITLFML